jgi:hypothetical protein
MSVEIRAVGLALFDFWTEMWNGNTALASVIMARSFTLHYAQANTERFDQVHSPEALAEVVDLWRTYRPGIRFSAEAEAVVDLELIADGAIGKVARPYLAVFTDPQGQVVARSGIDVLRVSAGRIVEVWSVSSGAAGRTFYPQGV